MNTHIKLFNAALEPILNNQDGLMAPLEARECDRFKSHVTTLSRKFDGLTKEAKHYYEEKKHSLCLTKKKEKGI